MKKSKSLKRIISFAVAFAAAFTCVFAIPEEVQATTLDNLESQKENLIDKHISEATLIDIPYGVDIFSLEFSVPEYTNPQRIVCSYRLHGFDPAWKTAFLSES